MYIHIYIVGTPQGAPPCIVSQVPVLAGNEITLSDCRYIKVKISQEVRQNRVRNRTDKGRRRTNVTTEGDHKVVLEPKNLIDELLFFEGGKKREVKKRSCRVRETISDQTKSGIWGGLYFSRCWSTRVFILATPPLQALSAATEKVGKHTTCEIEKSKVRRYLKSISAHRE